jgi:hypothetical protein
MNNLIERKETEVGIKPTTKPMFERFVEQEYSRTHYERHEGTSRSERFITAEQQYSSSSNLHISPSPMQN